jgi:HSP20 family protein
MQTALTRWTPATDLVRHSFNRMLDQTFTDFFAGRQSEDVATRGWLPPVDIRETDEALSLLVELPGLKREDVEITLENGVITIRGERKFEKDVKEENYHRIERSYGAFSRSFTLARNVQSDKVKATFTDGVLHVDLPKSEEARPRRIDIK